jgi:hypothetical protein
MQLATFHIKSHHKTTSLYTIKETENTLTNAFA